MMFGDWIRRTGHQISLAVVRSRFSNGFEFRHGFDTLGDHGGSQLLAHPNDVLKQHPLTGVDVEPPNQFAIEFNDTGFKVDDTFEV